MKLSEKIAAYNSPHPFYTFEFFPPRTDQGFENLITRISRLSSLNPIAISITWGAGGSTKERSLDLAGLTQAEYEIDTVLHLTCTNMKHGMVDDVLKAAKARGIQNILALRGDPPRGQEHWIPIDPRFNHGIDLVTYIRSHQYFSSDFCIGVAAYPEGHPDGETDEDKELEFLKAKVDAGADFIVTQLFYDVDRFLHWVKRVREIGITVPIIPGIMPIQTYSSFLRLIKLCGVSVPSSIMSDLESIQHDDQMVKDYGVQLAIDTIKRITTKGTVPGIHFCTLNLEKSVQLVLENLQWAGGSPVTKNKLIAETPGSIIHPLPGSELIITPSSATSSAANALTTKQTADTEVGRGEVNYAATWDDFPNGRFGDYKSPAFGDLGPWGAPVLSRTEVIDEWGSPKTEQDLTELFVRYLHSEITTTPFSPSALSPESLRILSHLERLTQRGWWTVGSQPAVDCGNSTDPVFGWGPRGGYVFQKSFVEFFADEEAVKEIVQKIEKEGQGVVHYFAGNMQGECRSNVPEDGRNAVTWGIFPGQEIVQTTIIERESFLSWKDEAFSIWAEWASFYPPGSQERELLDVVMQKRWLVSIVHHDYRNPGGLWTFLFGGNIAL
ncbi:hypothetical protein SERLA73DRAFT_95124 [Serpula lacrymans var. lacrymans S7.3]|uniref:MTHFR SAM-binding regulatory domain-containing protein n=2 Tax=Serpula lacrymans var. lacrymans TaxID=341189 RepID=F8Q7Q5_SERL3|nr:uncharacterized protein SERLADRAFT_363249 [Serpula lacrymans var. lacrymans S7.9]EGN95593.1 hypothetical protein SERLA73DRAFT_95124 [Serpula lacrymans var. lacrymans S7.3]EGO21122.1 hypothetical protein SERLADRAFT_363249 [Serpula lacrymans var. lacrymans S7.9]